MTTTTNRWKENNNRRVQEVINKLERMRDRDLSDDRARLAKLRRGLGRVTYDAEVHSVVQSLLAEDVPQSIEKTLYIIGPLFALHRSPYYGAQRINMGNHYRALAKGEDLPPAVERRFLSLLAAEPAELPDALRQAVTLLKSNDVPVNWPQLFLDVQSWLDEERERQAVRLDWSRSLWRLSGTQTSPVESQPQQSLYS